MSTGTRPALRLGGRPRSTGIARCTRCNEPVFIHVGWPTWALAEGLYRKSVCFNCTDWASALRARSWARAATR